MFFKVKCPHCGCKNAKERTTCAECGRPLDLGQVESRQIQVTQRVKPSLSASVSAFRRTVKEKLRDKTRDELCVDLCAMGLDAGIAERDRQEEDIVGNVKGKSLGLIQIQGSSIHWLNLLKHTKAYAGGAGGGSVTTYTNVYISADPTIRNYIELQSIRVKSVPLIGRIVDLRWESNLKGDLTKRMDEDVSLKEMLIDLNEDVEICSVPGWGWAVASKGHKKSLLSDLRRELVPSRKQWNCYERIARYLLESSKE